MFDNAVVGVRDYARGRDAIDLARALVSPDGKIELVYVEIVPSDAASDSLTGADAERQRFGLERLERLRDEAHIAAEVSRIQADSVRQGLYQSTAGRGADLIVIAASRAKRIEHVLLGDDTRELLEDPQCAVAVAPVGYCTRSTAMSRIGVAYDGSAESERALALARRIAAEHSATLSAFEAVRAPLHAHAPPAAQAEMDDEMAQARDRIAALGTDEPHAELADDVVEALGGYAGSVDLLVIGPHRRRPPDHHPERSKSQRLAEHPASPLLVLA